MVQITTSAPIFYSAGTGGASAVVGFESGRNRVARYTLTVPVGVTASKISFNCGQVYQSGGSASAPIRYKLTTSPDSYTNAGAGSAYDGSVVCALNGGRWYASGTGNITINSGGTYYLWVFPGNAEYGFWGWNSNAMSIELTEERIYQLTLSPAEHTTLQVKRNGIILSSGAAITYGDVLTITYSGNPGHSAAATLNGSPISSGATHTVIDHVNIVTTAQAQGLIYIDTGAGLEAYQVFIDSGTAFEQHMPYIDNGSNWNMCS